MNFTKLTLLSLLSLVLLYSCNQTSPSSSSTSTTAAAENNAELATDSETATATDSTLDAPSAAANLEVQDSIPAEYSSLSMRKGQAVAEEDAVAALYRSLNTGGTIALKNLIYYLDRPLRISGADGFTLDGNGCTFIMENKSEDVLIVENSANVTLKNFKATHIEPEGPIGCTGSVVQVNNCNGVTIEKCELNGSGIIGVMAYETQKLNVTECYIYYNSKYGILYDKNTSLEINGNKFEDNGQGKNAHVGLALDDFLSEVEDISAGTNNKDLKMADNIFK